VVTISRQAGCPAGVVSEYLLKRLKDERFGPDPAHWRIINKEILSEAARELGLSEDKINYIIEIGMRSTMEEIIAALSSKYYKSDRKIRKTVAEVIRTIAASGSVIIVGRGGVALTQDIPGSLHIYLEAPESWRVRQLMKHFDWKEEKALKTCREWDTQREKVKEMYGAGSKSGLYHVSFSCDKLKPEEISASAYHLLTLLNKDMR